MSQIFDALQRSESERSGNDTPAMSRATELLRRTESYAASKWETAALGEEQDAVDGEEQARAGSSMQIGPLSPTKMSSRPRTGRSISRIGGCRPVPVASDLTFSQSRLVCLPDGDSPAVEAFHLLGVRLRHLRTERPLKKVLITSTIPQEGKSLVAANLACTLALQNTAEDYVCSREICGGRRNRRSSGLAIIPAFVNG